MKIIHAHKYFYMRAGAERYMLGLAKRQIEAGHTVAPFAMHYPKNDATPWSDFFVSELETESGAGKGLSAIKQFGRAFWSFEAERKMSALIDAFEPDIIHAHNLYTHLSPSPLRATHKAGVPVVLTVHDYALISANYSLWAGEKSMELEHLGILETARTRFIKNSYLATLGLSMIQKFHQKMRCYDRYVSKYLAVSDFVAEALVKNGFQESKIIVTNPFFEKLPESKVKDDGSVVFIGRLEKYKGVQTLIRAMKKFPDTKLKIAGTGNYEIELRDQAREMKNVEFLGFVAGQGLSDLMSKARVVVIPSIWDEPFGLVAVEAMSFGTPVIVSDKGGLQSIIEDRVTGMIFRARDALDLERKLAEFVNNKAQRDSFGEVAREFAYDNYSGEAHLGKIMDIYKDVISK